MVRTVEEVKYNFRQCGGNRIIKRLVPHWFKISQKITIVDIRLLQNIKFKIIVLVIRHSWKGGEEHEVSKMIFKTYYSSQSQARRR